MQLLTGVNIKRMKDKNVWYPENPNKKIILKIILLQQSW